MINLEKFPAIKNNGFIYKVIVKNTKGIQRAKCIYIVRHKDSVEFKRVNNKNVEVICSFIFRESRSSNSDFYHTDRYKKSEEYIALKNIKNNYEKLLLLNNNV